MKKLMDKIMLTCKQATFFSSKKNFQKLKFVHRLQLKIHFMACTSCHKFDHQSQIIDKSMVDFYQNTNLQSEECLSKEKFSRIKSVVNQHIK